VFTSVTKLMLFASYIWIPGSFRQKLQRLQSRPKQCSTVFQYHPQHNTILNRAKQVQDMGPNECEAGGPPYLKAHILLVHDKELLDGWKIADLWAKTMGQDMSAENTNA
jgi:hypothetical protein